MLMVTTGSTILSKRCRFRIGYCGGWWSIYDDGSWCRRETLDANYQKTLGEENLFISISNNTQHSVHAIFYCFCRLYLLLFIAPCPVSEQTSSHVK